MSLLLAELEADPFERKLDPKGPFIKYLNCLADFAPTLPKPFRKAIKNPRKWPALAKKLGDEDRIVNSFLSTTQAIDLIEGGVKINALPEVVKGESSPSHMYALPAPD